ncbi:hypothetical protein FACS1894174_03140 [Bacteroidia bacterium]|nr:hypothetical protein FACS1894174_03140 [Bacteroidia bacterium]
MCRYPKILLCFISLSFLIVSLIIQIITFADSKNREACNESLNTQKAITKLQQAIKINPYNPLYHANLGLLYEKLNLIDNAITHFQKAYTLNPNDAGFCFNLGLLYQQIGDVDRAILSFEKANRIDMNNIISLIHLGMSYEKLHQIVKSEKVYTQVLVYTPDILDSQFFTDLKTRNNSLFYSIMKNAQVQLEHNIEKRDPLQIARLGKILLAQGNISKAKTLLETSISILPNLNRPYLYLGQIALFNKDSIVAKNYFEKAVALDPSDIFAIWNLSQIEKNNPMKRQLYYSSIVYIMDHHISNRYNRNVNIYGTSSLVRTEIANCMENYIQPKLDITTIRQFVMEHSNPKAILK